jgi:hypothetical protein
VSVLEAIRSTLLAGTVAEADRQATLNALARGGGTHDDKTRLDYYELYNGWYCGELGSPKLTGRMKAYLERDGFIYRENFCKTVVQALIQCLELSAVTSDDEALTAWLAEVWEANEVDQLQGLVHTKTATLGDGYIVVDWTPKLARDDFPGLPRYTFNPPGLHRPIYDEHGDMILDAKCWPEGKTRRLNLYFPDRIEKWVTASTDAGAQDSIWESYSDPSDVEREEAGGGERWPMPWVDAAGEPLGIPVFHMRNDPLGDFGWSELEDVIPQMIGVLKQRLDLFEVLDYQGAGQAWATGVGTAAAPATFLASSGTVWTTPSETARFGRFDPADPTGTLEAIEQSMRLLAARSQTPLGQLRSSAQQPSAESNRSEHAPLYRKASDREVSYGGTWVMAARMAVKLHKLHVPDFAVPERFKLEAQWKAPDSNDPIGDLTALEAKKRLGVSTDTLLTEAGYDPDTERALREKDAVATADELARAFRRGRTEPPSS